MGPLVPEYISQEFNFVVAFLIGIAFGFILERAGFSSTRKLAGLFYGYDFTVLKVFFTAGVTGMLGVLFMGHVGLLDLSIIYVNPTFLWSAIVGGVIMGLGFVIGGFCPGTSVCAMAIGKIDAFAFVFGSLLGVLVFAEGYPLLEELYMTEAWGPVLIYNSLGISPDTFAVALTAVALIAFAVTARIQDNVNHIKRQYRTRMLVRTFVIGSMPVVLASFLFVVPTPEELAKRKINDAEFVGNYAHKTMMPAKLAWELVYKAEDVMLVDVRSPEEYKKSHLPLAINVPLDSMYNPQWRHLLETRNKKRVFYGDEDVSARKALILTDQWLEGDNAVLQGGKNFFQVRIMDPIDPGKDAPKVEHDHYRFATKASPILKKKEIQRSAAPIKPIKPKRRVSGGCA